MHFLKKLLKHENWKNVINAYHLFFLKIISRLWGQALVCECWDMLCLFYQPTFTLKILYGRL